MLLAVMCFVILDTFAKLLSESYPVWQIVWARYAFHLVLIVVVLRRALPRTLRTTRLPLQLLRSLLLVVTTALFFLGLSVLPLADAAAVMLLGPLFITALSVPLLREKVGPRRWAGVLVGLLAALAVVLGSFWLFSVATFFGGAYAAVVLSFRFAAADCVSPEKRARALSFVMAGGIFAGVIGSQLVTYTMYLSMPYMFAATYVAQAAVAAWKRLPVWLANRLGPHIVKNLP